MCIAVFPRGSVKLWWLFVIDICFSLFNVSFLREEPWFISIPTFTVHIYEWYTVHICERMVDMPIVLLGITSAEI